MRFTVSQSSLAKALSVVSKGIATHSTIPVLGGILMRAVNGTLEMQATVLDTSIRHKIAANVEEEGETVISGKMLSGIVKNLSDASVTFDGGEGGALLDAWDESVAIGGATLLYHRLSLFARLSALVSEVYGEVVPTERLACRYKASVDEAGPDGVPVAPDGRPLAELGRGELTEVLRERLAAARPDDVRRCQTTVGPHRDDVQFAIDGRDARTFGSQGQQRTVALAWKMAEVRLCERLLGERPLLLLDDVMSELDESRRACVTRFVEGGIQTVITTTNLGYFTPELLERTRVVHYGQ